MMDRTARQRLVRYAWTVALVTAMVAASEIAGQREVLFPEAAALGIGMWVVDKHVWRVRRWQVVVLMSAGATIGLCLALYSPLPTAANLAAAFLFAAACLTFSKTALVPLLSAVMLPVLLGAESWYYPASVFVLTLTLSMGQAAMERSGLRRKIPYEPVPRRTSEAAKRWGLLLLVLLVVAFLPLRMGYTYCILPPLVVTFVEFANAPAGFRKVPVTIFLLLAGAALLGFGLHALLHVALGLPAWVTCLPLLPALFVLFEWRGRQFAPAGAVALIPLLIPSSELPRFPLQALVGAAVFVGTAHLLFSRPLPVRRRAVVMAARRNRSRD